MDTIHDLGGKQGFGPIPIAEGDGDFHETPAWEQRMWAISRGSILHDITIDWYRHCIERMVPADYLSFPYFNKWCENYFVILIDNGVLTMDEVLGGRVDEPAGPAAALSLDEVLERNRGQDVSFEIATDTSPRFATGAQVRTLDRGAAGHTRLAGYARGRTGSVIAYRGHHAFADEGAKGNHVGQHLYTVAFTAPELWGPGANPRDSVTLDLWESYLVPA